LTDRQGADLVALLGEFARHEGPIVSVFRVDVDTLRRDEAPLDFLLCERSLCVNTTAAGGNASLMSIG
jgi:RHH-type proline utilization regulon transcriptional repressor/proline dehydrogenase/delta 1-pyrroline-5-carboxylate dehydrogenase